jgi:hypothetical protein
MSKWKGGTKRMAMAATLAAPPKPPPPPPSLWDIMKKNHTLVAAFSSPPPGDHGDTQLRYTQLVQVFFNTLFIELAVVHILAARMTDYETGLSTAQWFIAGTLSAFCSVFFGTVVCKLVFRWGNIHRRRTRKGPPRVIEFYRWLKKELLGQETLFHGVQTLWYEYRTKETKRVPKKAIKRAFVVARGHTAWLLNIAAAITSIVLCITYGIHFEVSKFMTTFYSWSLAAGETFLIVEPIIIGIVFATPRMIDRAMLPSEPKESRGPKALTLADLKGLKKGRVQNLLKGGAKRYKAPEASPK